MSSLPLVSISCITFNHSNYLRECFEGFLMQKTNFNFEVLVNDDASTDGTKAIIEEYTQKYPDIFFPIYQSENQYSKGVRGMMVKFNFPRARGKYIALCEGDDYWTDPYKLQKQVDFLEANEEYSMCTHVTLEKNEINFTENLFPSQSQSTSKSIEDYINSNFTATCSLVFHSNYSKDYPKWFSKIQFGDWAIKLLIFNRSGKKMMVLQDCMSVYRVNAGGIHGSLKTNNKSLIKAYKMHVDFINLINNELFLNKIYQKNVLKKKRNTFLIINDLYRKERDIKSLKYQFLAFYCRLKLLFIKYL